MQDISNFEANKFQLLYVPSFIAMKEHLIEVIGHDMNPLHSFKEMTLTLKLDL